MESERKVGERREKVREVGKGGVRCGKVGERLGNGGDRWEKVRKGLGGVGRDGKGGGRWGSLEKDGGR
jgi:hypothetical protein